MKNPSKYPLAHKPVFVLQSITPSAGPGLGASFSLCLGSFQGLWFWGVLVPWKGTDQAAAPCPLYDFACHRGENRAGWE